MSDSPILKYELAISRLTTPNKIQNVVDLIRWEMERREQ